MKATEHLEILVEEPSMEAFLRALLPRVLGDRPTFQVYPSNGKADLLSTLEARLRGYSDWLPPSWRVIVLVDRDDEDYAVLKQRLESAATRCGLRTRVGGSGHWQVLIRIAIEELEAWYFGEWSAVTAAYPRVPTNVPRRAPFRDPDAIVGGTWEAFERVLQRSGYHVGGLRKIQAARSIGSIFDPSRSRSASFGTLHSALREVDP